MVNLGRLRRRCFLWLSHFPTIGGDDTAIPRRWANAVGRARGAAGLCFCLVAQVAESPAARLEPAQRAKLFGSFILLSIGCIALVILSWLALRVGRRNLRREDLAIQQMRKLASADDWAARPLDRPDGVGRDSELE